MPKNSDPVVSIAVSGGGHRASAWALGLLQAVLDAGLGPRITSVASVSGGSITNAVVADAVDLQSADRNEFDQATSRLRDVMTTHGLFFPGSAAANRYVGGVFALLCLLAGTIAGVVAAAVGGGRTSHWWWLLAGAPALAAALWSLRKGLNRIKGIGSTFDWLLVAGAFMAIGGVAGALSVDGTSIRGHLLVVVLWVVVLMVVGWITVRQLARRGDVVRKMLDAEFFDDKPLADVAATVDHIFATTDLETADSLYLAPRFVASYRRGVAPADGVSLAQAAQASAALPVGFPPSSISPSKKFSGGHGSYSGAVPIPVSDGGAYDNMGDQWDIRREARVKEWKKNGVLPAGLGPDPELLIVANASGAWLWESWEASSSLGTEITSIAKNQGVQYDQSTATRRTVLFNEFASGLRLGKGLRGVIIQIDRSPFQVVDYLPSAEDVGPTVHAAMEARADVARDALAALSCDQSSCTHERSSNCVARDRWDKVADFNKNVPTTLGPIGQIATESVMAHARVSTAMYLYVLHGLADLSQLEAAPRVTP